MTVRAAKDYLDMDALHQKWATLVPVTSAKPPDPGRLRLALRDLSDESAVQANTKTFLASLVTGGAFVVDVNAPLDGLSDDDTLLRALHLHPSQAAGAGAKADPKAPPPEANVDMDHDAKNDSVVQSMSATGKIIAPDGFTPARGACLPSRNGSIVVASSGVLPKLGEGHCLAACSDPFSAPRLPSRNGSTVVASAGVVNMS